jgi:hypothetical protein
MKELVLVFLFGAGQVQYTSFGQETIAVQIFADNEDTKTAFVKQLKELTEKPNVKVCAVVPSYDYSSPLHKPLDDLLNEKGDKLPGIWEEQEGIRRIFKLRSDTPISIEQARTFCKLAAPTAFK